ncbi:MAG TPA: mechanosensitive ion channel [Lachnospiraceae bacterium]|nr:mechanosensitive ion channel [Lachnospiraceae bacterium]
MTTISAGNLTGLVSDMNIISDSESLNQEKISIVEKYLSTIPEKLLNLGIRILIVAILFIIGVQVIRFIRKIINRSLTKAAVETGSVNFIDACVKVVLYVFLIVILAGNFGIDAASIVALMGSAALTIGLSFQGSLSNFAGGVLLLVSKTFKVGDYIIEGSGKNEGTVTEIGLFYTKLKTIDNKIVIVPNGLLANTTIVNATGMEHRRMELVVGISYRADIEKAKDLIIELLHKESKVEHDKEMLVFVTALNSSSVDIGTRFWIRTEDYWPVRWALLEKIKKTFDENNVEIPFNQLDVHMHP